MSNWHKKDIKNISGESKDYYGKFLKRGNINNSSGDDSALNAEDDYGEIEEPSKDYLKYFNAKIKILLSNFADLKNTILSIKTFSQLDGKIIFGGNLYSNITKYFYLSLMIGLIEMIEIDERKKTETWEIRYERR